MAGRAGGGGAEAGWRIADAARVEALLDDLARRVHAEMPEDFAIVGIRRRGMPLAQALAERVEHHAGRRIPVREIELKRYADDLTLLHEHPVRKGEVPDLRGEADTVLLVDDVRYSGHTLLRATADLVEGGVSRVRCAVLCARDAPEMPVRVDFVGMRVDVGPDGRIEVHVPPYEPTLGVLLGQLGRGEG